MSSRWLEIKVGIHVRALLVTLVALAVLGLPGFAGASTAAGSGAQGSESGQTYVSEWESPINKMTQSLTGPIAFAISLLAIVACVAALIFGGELNEFVRRLVLVVMGISVIVGASGFMSNLQINGALIS